MIATRLGTMRYAARNVRRIVSQNIRINQHLAITTRITPNLPRQCSRSFTVHTSLRMPGLMPDTEHPQPPNNAEQEEQRTATAIEEEDYHKVADDFLNNLYERAEQVVEQRDDVEVEYAVCYSGCYCCLLWRLTTCSGGCPHHHNATQWLLCDQQAASKQANLALQPPVRS